jgi:hypothetical protein
MKVLSKEQVAKRLAKLDADSSPEANRKFVEDLRAFVLHSGGVVRAAGDLTTDELMKMFSLKIQFHLIGAGNRRYYLLPKFGESFARYNLTSTQNSHLKGLHRIWPFDQT